MPEEENTTKVELNCAEFVEAMERATRALESFSVNVDPVVIDQPSCDHPTIRLHQNTKSKTVRVAEWLDSKTSKLWEHLPKILGVVALAALLVALFFNIRSCNPYDPTVTDTVQKRILEQVAKDKEEMTRKIEALEAELFEYQEQLTVIDEQIQAGALERDTTHETIDGATTISDIDDAIRKASKKPRKPRTVNATLRRPTRDEGAATGMDSNPY